MDERINVEELQLTTRCNGNCPLCNRATANFDKNRNMDIEVIKNLYPYERITLTGPFGEPTLHPHIFEVIKIIKDKGSNIRVMTNGSTHDTKWWSKFGKELGNLNTRNHTIRFPLDGLKENHEKYRGRSVNFDKIIDNIKSYIDAGGIADSFTIVFENNEHEIEKIREIVKNLGCRSYRLKVSWRYTDEWRRPKSIPLKTREEMEGPIVCNFFHGARGFKTVSIDISGRIHPCCHLVNRVGQTGVKDREIKYPKLFIAYLKSYRNLKNIDYAITSPYFNYVKENFECLTCAKRCRSSDKYLKQFETEVYWDEDVLNAWSQDQKICKKWIVEELNKVIWMPHMKHILIACGWYAVSAYYLFNFRSFGIGKITSVDKDPKCKEPAQILNKQFNFEAKTKDVFDITYDEYDMIVNTSCEHVDLRKWLNLIPQGMLMALQSTDMKHPKHITPVKNIESFKKQAGLSKILYEGEKKIHRNKHKRFMLIGIK